MNDGGGGIMDDGVGLVGEGETWRKVKVRVGRQVTREGKKKVEVMYKEKEKGKKWKTSKKEGMEKENG